LQFQCVYDRDFAAQWAKIFTDDLAACRRVTPGSGAAGGRWRNCV